MIEAKIDITINIPELTPELQQEIEKFGGRMPIRNVDLEDYDPELYKAKIKTARVYPKGDMHLALQSLSAKQLKDMCKNRDSCNGCLFSDETGKCTINIRPELWRI